MEKKFEHNEIEVCKFCHKNIDTANHQWIVVNGYNKNNLMETWFAHVHCFNDFAKGKSQMITQRVQSNIMGTVKSLFGDINKSLPLKA